LALRGDEEVKKKLGLYQYLKANKEPYLFIAPFFLVYIIFQLYPQIFSLILSVSEYRFGTKSVFVGLDNFTAALRDRRFWLALKNTLILWLGTLPLQLFAGFIIASLMVRLRTRIRGFLSGIYYLPVVTNLVAVTFMFSMMFDQRYGAINYLLSLIGIQEILWTRDPVWAKISVIILISWRGVGYYIVYILAGLMSVDKDYYEYSDIEGANYFQRHFYITIPLISPVLLYLAFTGTIAGWNIFLEPFLLLGSRGGIEGTALTTSMYVYSEGFANLKYGYGAAISLIIAVFTTSFVIMQFRIFNKHEGWR
jgi:ABC-type sugar transport system permease subunit